MSNQAVAPQRSASDHFNGGHAVPAVDSSRFMVTITGGYVSITSRLFQSGNIAYVRIPETERFSMVLIGNSSTAYALRLQPTEMTQLDKDPTARGTILGLVKPENYWELEAAWLHLRNVFTELDEARQHRIDTEAASRQQIKEKRTPAREEIEDNTEKDGDLDPAVSVEFARPTPTVPAAAVAARPSTERTERPPAIERPKVAPIEARRRLSATPWWAVTGISLCLLLGGLVWLGADKTNKAPQADQTIVPLR